MTRLLAFVIVLGFSLPAQALSLVSKECGDLFQRGKLGPPKQALMALMDVQIQAWPGTYPAGLQSYQAFPRTIYFLNPIYEPWNSAVGDDALAAGFPLRGPEGLDGKEGLLEMYDTLPSGEWLLAGCSKFYPFGTKEYQEMTELIKRHGLKRGWKFPKEPNE